MEVKMQTSFIPKKPIVESRESGSGISLFLLLSVILFIVTIALAGGIWLWQKSLVAKIAKDKASLEAAKALYEKTTIDPLIRLNDRIEESKTLLKNHIAVTPVFKMLELYVLQNIRLKEMKFSYTAGKIRVDLNGSALDFDALSKQSDAFGSENMREFVSQPVVSDFSPNLDGTVSFNFTTLVNPKLVSYEDTITQDTISPFDTESATSTIQ